MARKVYQANGPTGEWTLVDSSATCLAGAVERLWQFRGCTALPRERVLPDGLLAQVLSEPLADVDRAGRRDVPAVFGCD